VSPQLEILLIASVVSAACALTGVFLVLRRMALMSDAISHSILLGIVLAFFVVRDLNSPFLILGAAATGVLTVALVEVVHRTGLVKEDAAIGLVFPVLFSIGVILIARHADQVHLDIDAVLLGELAFAPFDRVEMGGRDLGPRSLWVMSTILLVNAVFIRVLHKELKVSTFDPVLAGALGFSPVLIHYAFMSMVSITAVGAFDAVGSILVIALMIAPPAAAYLLTDKLSRMIGLSVFIGVLSALTGYALATALDANIAGSMAAAAGGLFGLAFLLAPERGMIAVARRRARQRLEFAQLMLAIHLMHHEGLPEAEEENRLGHLHVHLRWSRDFAARVVRSAERARLIMREGDRLELTSRGRDAANHAIAH
jgi:manganese/zinc/iron transport system permease protein